MARWYLQPLLEEKGEEICYRWRRESAQELTQATTGEKEQGSTHTTSPQTHWVLQQPLLLLAHHAVSLLQRLLEAARAVAAGGNIVGNRLALRRGRQGRHTVPPQGKQELVLVENAKDVPGRGSWG